MFEEGKTYVLATRDGPCYMTVGPEQANGHHRAVKLETGAGGRKATAHTTTYLSPSQWREVPENQVPQKTLAKIRNKATELFGTERTETDGA